MTDSEIKIKVLEYFGWSDLYAYSGSGRIVGYYDSSDSIQTAPNPFATGFNDHYKSALSEYERKCFVEHLYLDDTIEPLPKNAKSLAKLGFVWNSQELIVPDAEKPLDNPV